MNTSIQPRSPGIPDWVNVITVDMSGITMMWESMPYFHADMRIWIDESGGKRDIIFVAPSIIILTPASEKK